MMFRRFLGYILQRFGVKIDIFRLRPNWPGDTDRFSYQRAHVKFDIKPEEKVLDIGSGAYPFPFATVLVDRFLEKTRHRKEDLVTNEKPLIVADISELPFQDKYFDFVYCSHILEHVEDPMKTCSEIMRVGYRGYIETPAYAKDMLFAWADGVHKWHVGTIADILVFFEYSKRQSEGIRTSIWRDIIFSQFYHPLQAAFYQNHDIFNTILLWIDHFKVVVFRLDGSMKVFGL